MLNKILVTTFLASSILFANSENSFTADVLTGDTKLSCEAILCLSSSKRPSECNPSIKRYFSISHKHWSDTVKARGNFLKLCPVGSDAEKDKEFTNLRDNIIKNLNSGCDLDQLNVENQKYIRDDNSYEYSSDYYYVYQINTSLSKSCKALASSSYTDIRPIYTCDPSKWYTEEDWRNGYEKIAVKTISRSEYNKLSQKEKALYEPNGFRNYTLYEKKEINKNCWIWQK